MTKLFSTLYNKALEGDSDCGGLLSYNYFSGEHITNFEEGRPLFVRSPESKFNLANFMRVNLFTALGALKTGLDILLKQEGVKLDQILGHGGLFKTKDVGQKIMAAAMDAPVSVMETAGEGGAWGIAILASYMLNKVENDCYMYKVIDVRLETTLMERILGIGTIHCFTGDVTDPDLKLQHIKNAKEIKDFILKQSEQERLKRKTLNMQHLDGNPEVSRMAATDSCRS